MGQTASTSGGTSLFSSSTTATVGHTAILLPREKGGGVLLLGGGTTTKKKSGASTISTKKEKHNDPQQEDVTIVPSTTLLVQREKGALLRLPGPPMTCPRMNLSATLCNNLLWIMGGDGGDMGVLDSIEFTTVGRVDKQDKNVPVIAPWKKVSHPAIRLPQPRAGHAAVLVHDRFLILIGGYNQHYHAQASVHVWDLQRLDEYNKEQHCHQEYEELPPPMDIICCPGPYLKQPRAHLGAVWLKDSNQILVAGGKGGHNKWHSTMETIALHPNPRNVHEVFLRAGDSPRLSSSAASAAASPSSSSNTTAAFASWKLLPQRLDITLCTHVFAFHHRPNWIVACGKSHVQLLDMSNLTRVGSNRRSNSQLGSIGNDATNTTGEARTSSNIIPFEHPRDYFYAAVFLEPRPTRAQILVIGKSPDSPMPVMEVVALPDDDDSGKNNDRSKGFDHSTVARTPPPSFPTLPSPPAPSSNFQHDWKTWMEQRQRCIAQYNFKLDAWKQRQTDATSLAVDERRKKIQLLDQEIETLETERTKRMDKAQLEADDWLKGSSDDLKSILEHMEKLVMNRAVAPGGNEAYSASEEKIGQEEEMSSKRRAAAPLLETHKEETSFHPPSHLCCPITTELMMDPVIVVEDGQTYERTAIVEWWATQETAGQSLTSPMTGPISSQQLVPNLLIRAQCQEWAEVYGNGKADHGSEMAC